MSKLILLVGLLLIQGCALYKPVAPGADPVVVNAERTIGYAKETMNAFVQYEYANRALINDPEVKKAADLIRANGVQWLKDAHNLKMVYKKDRTATNKTALEKAISILVEGLNISQKYLLKPKPTTATTYLWTPSQPLLSA